MGDFLGKLGCCWKRCSQKLLHLHSKLNLQTSQNKFSSSAVAAGPELWNTDACPTSWKNRDKQEQSFLIGNLSRWVYVVPSSTEPVLQQRNKGHVCLGHGGSHFLKHLLDFLFLKELRTHWTNISWRQKKSDDVDYSHLLIPRVVWSNKFGSICIHASDTCHADDISHSV